MRRLIFRQRHAWSKEIRDIRVEVHGTDRPMFIVARGERVNLFQLCKDLSASVPKGTPILRMEKGDEIEVWEETPDTGT
jgi:hypothetical protein